MNVASDLVIQKIRILDVEKTSSEDQIFSALMKHLYNAYKKNDMLPLNYLLPIIYCRSEYALALDTQTIDNIMHTRPYR